MGDVFCCSAPSASSCGGEQGHARVHLDRCERRSNDFLWTQDPARRNSQVQVIAHNDTTALPSAEITGAICSFFKFYCHSISLANRHFFTHTRTLLATIRWCCNDGNEWRLCHWQQQCSSLRSHTRLLWRVFWTPRQSVIQEQTMKSKPAFLMQALWGTRRYWWIWHRVCISWCISAYARRVILTSSYLSNHKWFMFHTRFLSQYNIWYACSDTYVACPACVMMHLHLHAYAGRY